MRSQFKKAALASALALLGAPAVQASIISTTDALGSEVLLSVVNKTSSQSETLDLGLQVGALTAGDYALPTALTNFINGAGGVSNVQFAVIGGTGGTAFDFLSTLTNPNATAANQYSNSTRTNWNGALGGLITGLNGSIPADLDTTVNQLYGPFDAGANPNYLAVNNYRWGIVATSTVNLADATAPLPLYFVDFSTALGFATVTPFLGNATATLSADKLTISAVPVPAAAWLFGSALGLLGISRRSTK